MGVADVQRTDELLVLTPGETSLRRYSASNTAASMPRYILQVPVRSQSDDSGSTLH